MIPTEEPRDADLEARKHERRAEFLSALHEALLHGRGRTLSLDEPRSARILVREMGSRVREYLAQRGFHVEGAPTPSEVIDKAVVFFAAHELMNLDPIQSQHRGPMLVGREPCPQETPP